MKHLVPVLATAVLVLSACGSKDASSASKETPTPQPSATTASASPTPTPTPTSAAGAVDLSLKIGQPATFGFGVESSGKETTTLRMTVSSVKTGSIADLKNFELDAQTKKSIPVYVTVKVTNVGDKTTNDTGGIFGVINTLDPAGDKLASLDLTGDFPKCDGFPPDHLAAGKSFTACQVYIAPVGDSADSVVFDDFIDSVSLDAVENKVTWKG